MKKIFISFIFTLLFFVGNQRLFAEKSISEPQIWINLYQGNWSISHKLMMVQSYKGINEPIISSLMFAYAKYRAGNSRGAIKIFKSIDKYIEKNYLNQY